MKKEHGEHQVRDSDIQHVATCCTVSNVWGKQLLLRLQDRIRQNDIRIIIGSYCIIIQITSLACKEMFRPFVIVRFTFGMH